MSTKGYTLAASDLMSHAIGGSVGENLQSLVASTMISSTAGNSPSLFSLPADLGRPQQLQSLAAHSLTPDQAHLLAEQRIQFAAAAAASAAAHRTVSSPQQLQSHNSAALSLSQVTLPSRVKEQQAAISLLNHHPPSPPPPPDLQMHHQLQQHQQLQQQQQVLLQQQQQLQQQYSPGGVVSGIVRSALTPDVDIKLFVGKIPRTVDEEGLRPIFEHFGPVRELTVIRDRESGQHKGCAFVRMSSITDADRAIREIHNCRVLPPASQPMQVKYALGEAERLGMPVDAVQQGVDQVKLFVGSLPKNTAEERLRQIFQPYGQITEVFVIKDEQNQSKGCGFVKFARKEEAFHAISQLHLRYPFEGNRAMEVRFAENKKSQTSQQRSDAGSTTPTSPATLWQEHVTREGRTYYFSVVSGTSQWERPAELDVCTTSGPIGGQSHGPPGANVFIFHVPNEFGSRDLYSLFTAYGQILSARIVTERSTGRHLGYGFVSFSDPSAAVQACQALNGHATHGKRLKVEIKRGEEGYAVGYRTKASPTNSSPPFPRAIHNFSPEMQIPEMQFPSFVSSAALESPMPPQPSFPLVDFPPSPIASSRLQVVGVGRTSLNRTAAQNFQQAQHSPQGFTPRLHPSSFQLPAAATAR